MSAEWAAIVILGVLVLGLVLAVAHLLSRVIQCEFLLQGATLPTSRAGLSGAELTPQLRAFASEHKLRGVLFVASGCQSCARLIGEIGADKGRRLKKLGAGLVLDAGLGDGLPAVLADADVPLMLHAAADFSAMGVRVTPLACVFIDGERIRYSRPASSLGDVEEIFANTALADERVAT